MRTGNAWNAFLTTCRHGFEALYALVGYATLRLVPGQSLATELTLENRSERTITPFPDISGS
jgi:hypothetical protein